MQKDLFQIAQMSDIYATLDQWAMLSPRLSHEQPIESRRHSKNKTNKQVNSKSAKKHIKGDV
jgi:hypothetical protein